MLHFPTLETWNFLAHLAGALPLLAYPVLLLANVMSLAGYRAPGAKMPLAASLFLWGSTAYPPVYGVCVALSCWLTTHNYDVAGLAASAAPLGYLGALWLLFRAWTP